MRNSIDYPGERAPRRPAVIAQAGYTGQNHFSVTYGDQKVTVGIADVADTDGGWLHDSIRKEDQPARSRENDIYEQSGRTWGG